MKKTTVTIGCFWFHIQWIGNHGKDQLGNFWLDPENPQLEDPARLDHYLDAYNDLQRKVEKL